MDVVLWIVAIIAAAAFIAAGLMHLRQPKEALDQSLGWPEDFSARTVKLIGTAELVGGAGLVLPGATDIATLLTPIAASGLCLVMLGAMATHVRRKEPQGVVVTLVLFALVAIVAWGRFGPYSF